MRNRLTGRSDGVNLLQGTPVPQVVEMAAGSVNLALCGAQRLNCAVHDEHPAVELVRQFRSGLIVRGAKGVGNVEVAAKDLGRSDVHDDEASAARSTANSITSLGMRSIASPPGDLLD